MNLELVKALLLLSLLSVRVPQERDGIFGREL